MASQLEDRPASGGSPMTSEALEREALLSCPCCGCTATEEWLGGAQIICENCGMGTSVEKSPEAAVAVWNRRVALSAPVQAPDGWVMVPVEPAKEQIAAYIAADPRRQRYAASAKRDYKAMLAASPSAPVQGDRDDAATYRAFVSRVNRMTDDGKLPPEEPVAVASTPQAQVSVDAVGIKPLPERIWIDKDGLWTSSEWLGGTDHGDGFAFPEYVRAALTPSPVSAPKVNAQFITTEGEVTGTQFVDVKAVRVSDDGSEIDVDLDYWPTPAPVSGEPVAWRDPRIQQEVISALAQRLLKNKGTREYPATRAAYEAMTEAFNATSHPSTAFQAGAEAERKGWVDHIDTLLESLKEGLMTDADLSADDRKAMCDQIEGLNVAKDIGVALPLPSQGGPE